jgi:hypothetical protein
MVLLRYLQLRSTWKWSLSNLVAMLRFQLFVYRDLWSWVNHPYCPPVEAETLLRVKPATCFSWLHGIPPVLWLFNNMGSLLFAQRQVPSLETIAF